MIELTEAEARAFVQAWDDQEQAPANSYLSACRAIADALAEVLPRPLNVGARVCYTVGGAKGDVYELVGIDGSKAWIKAFSGGHFTVKLADLVRAS